MSTHRIIAPFWRRRWLILTTTLTVTLGTLFWARGLPTIYESSLTLVASSKDGTTIPPGQLARIRNDLWSPTVIYPVVESNLFNTQRASGLSNDALVDRLQGSVNLTEHSNGSSTVIRLRYFDPSPERAQAIASMLGKTIETTEARNTAGTAAFRIDQPATQAPGTMRPRIHIVTMFALGRGILLGLLFAGLSELVGSWWRRRRQPELSSPAV